MSKIQIPIKKGYRYQIFPNEAQKQIIDKTFGCCRYVYNRALSEIIEEYKKFQDAKDTPGMLPLEKPKISGYTFANKLPIYKADPACGWLTEVSSITLQQSLLNLGNAFKRYFGTKSRYPKFKKKNNSQSFFLMKNGFSLKDDELKIAKCDDPIKVNWSRKLPSLPSSIIISSTPTGKYFVSFRCDYIPITSNGRDVTGIDLGITDLMTFSDGTKINNERYFVKSQKRLKRLQQSLARKKKGSSNRNKARIKVAKLYEFIKNSSINQLHQISRKLVNENQVIGLENLNVAGLLRNRKIAKHISEARWSMFKRLLAYKVTESSHVTLVMMDSFYASSHICSVTGKKLDRKLLLKERYWLCPYCGDKHDRDVNAAQNMAREAIRVSDEYSYDDRAGKIILANQKGI